MKRNQELGQANHWVVSGIVLLTLITVGFGLNHLAEEDRKHTEGHQAVAKAIREFHETRESAIHRIQEVQELRAANLERIKADLSTLDQIETNMRNRLQMLNSTHSSISHLQDKITSEIETSQNALSRLEDCRTLIAQTIKNQDIDDGRYNDELLLQERQIEELRSAIRDLQTKQDAFTQYGKRIDAFRDAVSSDLSDVVNDKNQLKQFQQNGLQRQKRSEENQRRLEEENRKLLPDLERIEQKLRKRN